MDDTLQVSKALLKDLNAMPYYKNYAATSGMVHNVAKHEDAVRDILLKHGFKEWTPYKGFTKEVAWSWIDNPALATRMPSMTFISQPCGSNDNPDFLVKMKTNVVFAIECKSSDKKTKKPLYNSGGITQNYIYVYSSQSTNSTTIYMGSAIMTEEQQKLINEHILKHRADDAILNEKLKSIDTNHRGVSYYTRPMIGQSGDSTYTDYFNHEMKSASEENVFKFVENMIIRS